MIIVNEGFLIVMIVSESYFNFVLRVKAILILKIVNESFLTGFLFSVYEGIFHKAETPVSTGSD